MYFLLLFGVPTLLAAPQSTKTTKAASPFYSLPVYNEHTGHVHQHYSAPLTHIKPGHVYTGYPVSNSYNYPAHHYYPTHHHVAAPHHHHSQYVNANYPGLGLKSVTSNE